MRKLYAMDVYEPGALMEILNEIVNEVEKMNKKIEVLHQMILNTYHSKDLYKGIEENER